MSLALKVLLQKRQAISHFKNAVLGTPAVLCRSFHVTSKVLEKKDTQSNFMFQLEGYNKYGLLKDDLLTGAWNKDVEEAIRRLPEEVRLQRVYRAIRAQQAEVSHSILPKEEWTTIDDDHSYLQPYLKEVVAEREEREEWEAKH